MTLAAGLIVAGLSGRAERQAIQRRHVEQTKLLKQNAANSEKQVKLLTKILEEVERQPQFQQRQSSLIKVGHTYTEAISPAPVPGELLVDGRHWCTNCVRYHH